MALLHAIDFAPYDLVWFLQLGTVVPLELEKINLSPVGDHTVSRERTMMNGTYVSILYAPFPFNFI